VRHVFFRSRRHESARGNPRVADRSDTRVDGTAPPQIRQLQEWRRSAQRVTRAWNAWLAAASRDADVRYRAVMAALADEERAAAEVERMIELPEPEHVTTPDARRSGLGAR
jgi:hypothetical protein